jgi:hypothetical protein
LQPTAIKASDNARAVRIMTTLRLLMFPMVLKPP